MPDAVIPLVLQPSFTWHGNDGNWSTFIVSVGSPPQKFHVLPSTVSGETWIPLSEGCSSSTFERCGESRGVLPIDGMLSSGFQQNESRTWQEIGIYGLGLEENIFGPDDSGLYGLDTMRLVLENGSSTEIPRQSIAGIATSNFWLGSLGLGIVPAAYDVQQQNVQSLATTLANKSLATSQSYGFSAGTSYRGASGGIVFGGFDADAFTPSNVDFDLYFSGARSLTASLRSVVVSNTLQGTRSLPIGPYNMSIDSTVSQLWLPRALCDSLEVLLGLTYDESTDLYLVNETARNQLLSRAPEFTFILSADASTNETTNIVLPFAAFDQQMGPPVFENLTKYFPVRRAANESQFVLGRTFLQEAYLVTDWTRRTFTLGQSKHRSGVSNNIVPILFDDNSSSQNLGKGAIVGIAVSLTVVIVACCLLGWWFWRKRMRHAKSGWEGTGIFEHYTVDKKGVDDVEDPHELDSPLRMEGVELETTRRYELPEDQIKHQLMSQPVYELPGRIAEHELPGTIARHELDAQERGVLPLALFSPDAVREPPDETTNGEETIDRFRRRFVV